MGFARPVGTVPSSRRRRRVGCIGHGRGEAGMSALSIGIVGLGYWGPNLLRNFRSIESCRVVAIADANPARLAEPSRMYPDLRTHGDARALIGDPEVEAVVLALPAGLLPDLAEEALRLGKHVIVEKPMADSL